MDSATTVWIASMGVFAHRCRGASLKCIAAGLGLAACVMVAPLCADAQKIIPGPAGDEDGPYGAATLCVDTEGISDAAMAQDGKRLYVASFWPGHALVSVIDTTSDRVVNELPIFHRPQQNQHVDQFPTLTLRGSRLYAIESFNRRADVIDLPDNGSLSPQPIENWLRGSAVSISADGTRAYSINADGTSIGYFDTKSNAMIHSVGLPRGTRIGWEYRIIGLTLDASKAYIAHDFDNHIIVIGGENGHILSTLGVLYEPTRLVPAPGGKKAYMSDLQQMGPDGFRVGNTMSVFDESTDEIISKINTGVAPSDVEFSQSRPVAYFVAEKEGAVGILDTQRDIMTGRIKVGRHPTGVFITPEGTKAYVPNWEDYTISVLDLLENHISTTLKLKNRNAIVLFSSVNHHAYVVSRWKSDGVGVIDTLTDSVIGKVPIRTSPIQSGACGHPITTKPEN